MKLTKKNTPWILFGLLTIVCAFIFGPYIFGKTDFILGWDMEGLYISNFEALRTQFQNWTSSGNFSFWSWVSFLGNDFYSSKLFYFQDIFDYPFAFSSLPYTTIIMIQTYMKFLVAAFSFYAYSRYNKYSLKTCLTASLIFTFSAYNLQTMMHPFFGSFFVFLPLYFLTIDRYLKDNKYYGFIFMVFFMLVNNYYLFYSVSLCTVIYFIYRYRNLKNTMKGWFVSALKLVGYYVIGFMLSGIVVIPEVLQILSNSRVGARSSILLYDSILPYVNYLIGIFTPTSVLANRNTLISTLYSYTSANNSVLAVFLWSSSLVALLFFQRFCKKNRKPFDIQMITIITAISLIPILSSIMHGFSEASFRWLGSISFFLIAAILPYIEDYSLVNKRILKYSTLLLIALTLLSTPILCIMQKVSFKDVSQDYWLSLIFLPTLITIGFGLFKNKRIVVFCALIIELSLTSFLSFRGNPEFSKRSKEEVERTSTLLGTKDEYNDYVLSLDDKNNVEFYRNYIDPVDVYWQLSLNYNLNYNIKGLISYDSTFHPSANKLKEIGNVSGYLPWVFNIEDPNIMNLVSTKYAAVTKEERVPFANSKKVGDYYGILIYENLDYINLGKTYTSVITIDNYDKNDTSLVTQTVIAESKDVDDIEQYVGNEEVQCNTVTIANDYLYADINLNKDGFIVLSVPYDSGWNIKVNNSSVKPYEVNGGFIGLPLKKGYNEIQMTFFPSGLKYGIIISGLGIIILVFTCFTIKFKNNKNNKKGE